MGKHVLLEKKGFKAYIILNKPEKLNALDAEMYADVRDYLTELDKDPKIRVVIMKGNGRAFSAGFDITQEMNVEESPLEERMSIRDGNNAARWKMWDLSKPVIVQVHGHCLGGACDLMLPGDYVIAADDASIGEPQIQFGGAPVFMLVPWLTGIRKSKELMLTGEKISGKEAAACGLFTKSVPAEELEDYVEALADKLIKMPPEIMYIQKLGINRAFETMGLRAAMDTWLDMSMFFRIFKTEEIEEFSRISAEQGVKAALKWRDEYFAEQIGEQE